METVVKNRKRQHNELKSITLFYNEKNKIAINTINYLLTLGVLEKFSLKCHIDKVRKCWLYLIIVQEFKSY